MLPALGLSGFDIYFLSAGTRYGVKFYVSGSISIYTAREFYIINPKYDISIFFQAFVCRRTCSFHVVRVFARAFMGMVFINEAPAFWTLVGGALVMSALLLRVWAEMKFSQAGQSTKSNQQLISTEIKKTRQFAIARFYDYRGKQKT